MRGLLAGILSLCLLLSGCALLPHADENQTLPTVAATLPINTSEQTEATDQSITTDPTETTGVSHIPPTVEGKPPADGDFVRVLDYIPDAVIDLKYATTDNFTGKVIYQFTDAYLRYSTVKKLMAVQAALKAYGFRLKIWDAFRPIYGQQALWDAFPDPNYVSNPATGTSSHCRGNTVDITLVDKDGKELAMPTGFDDFTKLADRDYSDCSAQAAANAKLLEDILYANGFRGYRAEWWHFTDLTDYDIERDFDPANRG